MSEEMGFALMPDFELAPPIKPLMNIGGLLDVPTGTIVKGLRGESILNGGLGMVTGVVGIGNNWKSTIMHGMALSAAERYSAPIDTYDTEMNIQEFRLKELTQRFPKFKGRDLFREKQWRVSDKSVYFANEWYEIFKKFLRTKEENSRKYQITTPFPDREGKSALKLIWPSIAEIDSFSEFETEDVAGINDANELGESGGNTIHMRQGLSKIRFLSDVIKRITVANSPLLMTAHVGKDIPMDPRAGPVKKLTTLKNGDKIKGTTDKFLFLTHACWQAQNSSTLMNDGTKGPEYPRAGEDVVKGDNDLMTVTLVLLRNKNGPSGNYLQVVVSQSEGWLRELSEFHYIKANDRFGLEGSLQNYSLSLLPEVKLSRTTVRGKIDSDPTLCRALNITSELCQMKMLWHDVDQSMFCTPAQLRDDLIALGYDWSILLNNSRGWWAPNNHLAHNGKHFLSSWDLLEMRKGNYHPYWLGEDKKTIIEVK